MAKRRKQPRSLPKRVLGVRIPKSLRRAADTQLGSAIMAQLIISGGRAGLQSDQARQWREQAQMMMRNLAASVSQAAQAVTQPPRQEALEDRGAPIGRRGRRTPETDADDRPH